MVAMAVLEAEAAATLKANDANGGDSSNGGNGGVIVSCRHNLSMDQDEATLKPNASTIRKLEKYVHKICTRGWDWN
jgi:hypothetical protein